MKPIILIISAIIVFIIVLSLFKKEDYNCTDFEAWTEADEIFKKHEQDVYHLDRDSDGVPCESLLR